jgi:dethiobiotin synthase
VVTILVSGSGTGVGKTRVTAALARAAHQAGRRVQIVKPVQTGIAAGRPSDADDAAALAGLAPGSAHTLRRYPAALAPVAAAEAAGLELNIMEVLGEITQLPETDVRLIEGAGGLAVPLGNAFFFGEVTQMDWKDLGVFVKAEGAVLVVPDELGAINQARLVHAYFSTPSHLAKSKMFRDPAGGVFLNALKPPPPEVTTSTRDALERAGVPRWGELAADAIAPRIHEPLAKLLGLA